MKMGEWLASREPVPPAELSERLRGALGTRLSADIAHAPELFLDSAEALLTRMLNDGSASRESALDLLTVDALVTYAFEAGGEMPAELRSRADDAMRRMAALGAAHQ